MAQPMYPQQMPGYQPMQQPVIVQPVMIVQAPTYSNNWSTGLFDCFSDWGTCCLGYWCPCVLAAHNKANADFRECTACDCLCCPQEYYTHAQIRSYYGLPSPCTTCNCCMWCYCYHCSVCMDARELKARRGDQYGVGIGGMPPVIERMITPPDQSLPAPKEGEFTTSLFDCFSDFGSCLLACCCPTCAFAKNKAAADGRPCDICDALCYPSEWFTRKQLKSKFGIKEVGEWNDCLLCVVFCFCAPCLTCQDSRELKIRRNAQAIAQQQGAPMVAQMTMVPQYGPR